MKEMLVLVDDRDREIGTAEKLDAHRQGRLHRAFSVFVFDAAGALLLQRRADGKYHSGGLWTNTCCGHPRPGEAVEDAAHRRLGEEMGFDCALRNVGSIVYELAVTEGLTEHEFDHLFIGRADAAPRPDPQEVQEWAWMPLVSLRESMQRAPQAYTVWLHAIVAQAGFARLTQWSAAAAQAPEASG